MIVRANGLNYAFTQREDIVLTAMAHRCPEWSLLGDEREETIQDQNINEISL
jgi:hypothetical protein